MSKDSALICIKSKITPSIVMADLEMRSSYLDDTFCLALTNLSENLSINLKNRKVTLNILESPDISDFNTMIRNLLNDTNIRILIKFKTIFWDGSTKTYQDKLPLYLFQKGFITDHDLSIPVRDDTTLRHCLEFTFNQFDFKYEPTKLM